MTTSRFSQLLASKYEKLSASRKVVAQFFNQEPWTAAVMSAAEIAQKLEVDASTVVRFAQALGYAGLTEMQKEIQESVMNSSLRHKDTLERAEFVTQMVGTESSEGARLLERVFQSEVEHAQKTYAKLNPDECWAVAEFLLEARGVYVIGLRGSAPLAVALTVGLRYLRPHVNQLTEGFADLPDQMLSLGQGDALIAFSYTPYVANVVQCMEAAKAQGAKIIAITDDQLSPAGRIADHTLLVHNPLWLISSDAGSIALVNTLLFAVAARGKKRYANYRNHAKEVVAQFTRLLDHANSTDRLSGMQDWLAQDRPRKR